MAPKKARTTRGRRPRVAGDGEERREEPSAPSPPVAPPTTTIFCANRTVTTGRHIDFSFLDHEGFSIGERLRAQGWEHLCTLKISTYPGLVREMFSDMALGDLGYTAYVRGTLVEINEDVLSTVLQIPKDGEAPTSHPQREIALNLILGREDCGPLDVVYSQDLNAEMRLLLSIVNRVLFPKTGRFDFVSERDLVIMHHILLGIPLNLPRLMLNYIALCHRYSRFSIPYGMIFTLIFKHFKVPIPPNEPAKALRNTDYYNEGSMRRMEFHKIDGSWVKVPKRKAQTIEPEIPHHEPDHHSPPPSHMNIPDIPSSSAGPSTSMPPPPPVSGPSFLSEDQMHTLASAICQQIREEMRSMISTELAPIRASHEGLLQEMKDIRSQIEATTQEIIGVGATQTIRSLELKDSLKSISKSLKELTKPDGNVSTLVAQLRGRIEMATIEFEALVAGFHKSQGDHFKTLMDSINAFIDAACKAYAQSTTSRPHEQRRR